MFVGGIRKKCIFAAGFQKLFTDDLNHQAEVAE
jgi:hypothetical protein